MQWSREAMLRNECQFDSFAKKVMRNFARNWFHKRQWRSTKEIIVSELPVATHPEPLHTDWHESENTRSSLGVIFLYQADKSAQIGLNLAEIAISRR